MIAALRMPPLAGLRGTLRNLSFVYRLAPV